MVAVISLIIVLVGSMMVTKVATVALSHTGLSRESARFQARSAFTGSGFTTHEAEQVVNHPVRRRIVMVLMLLGNAGIISAVSSLILAFVGQDVNALDRLERVGIIGASVLALWALAASPAVDRGVSRFIGWALKRWTRLDVRDYQSLLHLAEDYRVHEVLVEPEDWMSERALRELGLREEGILVLGVQRRGGRYLGAPVADTVIHEGDVLLVYGREAAVARIDERRRGTYGDREHAAAVAEQHDLEQQQAAEDAEEAEVAEPASTGKAERAGA